MKKKYTIASLKSLQDLPKMDCVQVTLNGRIFPSSRKTVSNLQELRKSGDNTRIIIHYDFIYIISRYAMFKDSVRHAIMSEIAGIMSYCEKDSNILGIVMHTDWPVKKEYQKAEDKIQFIADNYNGSLWDQKRIEDVVDKNVVEKSIVEFANDLMKYRTSTCPIKIFLENTTKVGPNGEGTLNWIVNLFHKYPNFHKIFGIVYDTEHHFAVTGEWLAIEDIFHIYRSVADVIVHVNTVPSSVKPCSGKDRHSETTIAECSINSKDYYEAYTSSLDRLNIEWVREVKEDTMFRELGL